MTKSYVNRRVREAVRPKLRMLKPYVLGRKALDTARAHLERLYHNIPAGYCFQADDFTMPVYWHVPDGAGWFKMVRGQCLIVIDFRTLRILGFSLQPDKNYSSPVIHTLLTRVFTDWGVPAILYFESGIWESSKLITGGVKAQRVPSGWEYAPLSQPEVSKGFGDLGVKFKHAIRARSKNVERVGGLVQDLMEGEPGYCGRDERRDCPDLCKRQLDDVRFHRKHPAEFFYDQAQWLARLNELFTRYNATRQEGKILAGLSPDEAQEQLQDAARAPMNFDACRHLLAHWKVPVTVGNNGITIQIGGRKFIYRNAETGRDKFRRRLAWFNPDEPSILAVTDLNMRNPYSVELSRGVDALNPDPQVFAEELAKIAAHESYGKALYQTLKARFQPAFRRVLPCLVTVDTGEQMREQREAIQATQRKADTRKRTIRNRADRLELPAAVMQTDDQADEGTARMLAAKRAHESKQSGPAEEAQP